MMKSRNVAQTLLNHRASFYALFCPGYVIKRPPEVSRQYTIRRRGSATLIAAAGPSLTNLMSELEHLKGTLASVSTWRKYDYQA